MVAEVHQWLPVAAPVYGLVVGSFLNVVSLRYVDRVSGAATLPANVGGRSVCASCGAQLRWWELIPVVSFVLLRGRCQRCRAAISYQYPFIELSMAFIAWQVSRHADTWITLIFLTAISAVLLVMAVIDFRTFLLPDTFIIAVCVLALLLLFYRQPPLTLVGWGVLCGAGFLLLLWVLTRGRGIGLGDVKLMLPLGVLFGFPGVLVLLFIAFCSGGLLGLILLARGAATLKTAVPFGPFLITAALLLLLWPQLIPGIFALL